MSEGTVDTNKIVIGWPHAGTYDAILEDGNSLIISFPYVARSVAVLAPAALRWVNTSNVALADIPERSVPTQVDAWHERVRQCTQLVLHNATGGAIAANAISWDAELTEVPSSDYPDRTNANGFDGMDDDYAAGVITEVTPT
jgi:hypothetical protein